MSQLIAAVTIVLPNRQTGEKTVNGKLTAQIKRGKVLKAGEALDIDSVSNDFIRSAIKRGILYEKATPVALKDVSALRRESDLNVSSTKNQAGDEDNPLDDGIELESSGKDPALEGKLAEIQAEQAEAGIEHPADGPSRAVEVNAETGEMEVTGGEDDFEDHDDLADSQVS